MPNKRTTHVSRISLILCHVCNFIDYVYISYCYTNSTDQITNNIAFYLYIYINKT